MSPSALLKQPPLTSFLLSQSTILCLTVRLAIIFQSIPSDLLHWLQEDRAIQSMIHRPVQHSSILLFDATQSWNVQPIVTGIPYLLLLLLLDLVTACGLVYLGQHLRQQQDSDEEEELLQTMPDVIRPTNTVFAQTESDHKALLQRSRLPLLSGSLYLWGTLASSSSTIDHIYQGLLYNSTISWLWSRCGDPLVLMFLVPLYLSIPNEKKKQQVLPLFLGLAALYLYAIFPSLSTAIPTYSTPNLGVQWYFGMQIFDRFRAYFGVMFFGLRFVLIAPLALRLLQHPVELATCYWFVWILFTPHVTVTDLMVALSLLLLSPRSCGRMGIPSLVALSALPVPLLLYHLDWEMWLVTGSGNANFIYFQCLAYNAFVATLFIDYCGAVVKRQTALQLTKKAQHQSTTITAKQE